MIVAPTATIRTAIASVTPWCARRSTPICRSPSASPLHRQIGEAIEAGAGGDRDAHAAELAHHFREAAADGDAERAIHYGIRAGERATQALAHEEAVAHYERTLQLLRAPDADRRGPPLPLADRARLGAGRAPAIPPAAEADVRPRRGAGARARPAGGARARRARHRRDRAPERPPRPAARGGARRARRRRQRAARAAPLPARGRALLGAVRRRANARSATTRSRWRARLGYVPTLAYALSSRIAALSGPDDVEARLAASQEMVGARRPVRPPRARDDRPRLEHRRRALARRRAPRALSRSPRSPPLAEESRHPYFVWWLAAIRTMQAILEGRLAEAETLAQECFALGQRAVAIDADAGVRRPRLRRSAWRAAPRRARADGARASSTQFPDIPGGHAGSPCCTPTAGAWPRRPPRSTASPPTASPCCRAIPSG